MARVRAPLVRRGRRRRAASRRRSEDRRCGSRIPAPPGAAQAMWLAFGQLRNIPTLALRGAHSDLLSAATFERMQSRSAAASLRVTVPNRGHAPQLDEPRQSACDRCVSRRVARVATVAFKDHFSGHASAYARYRPDYPSELFDYLATLTPRREVALDCATGNGQAALGLARHYDLRGRDRRQRLAAQERAGPSARRLSRQPRGAAGAEGSRASISPPRRRQRTGSITRVSIREMRRVLRPDGALALWTYGLAFVDAADRCRRPAFLRGRRRAVLAAGASARRERLSRPAVSVARSRPRRNSSCASSGPGRLRRLRRHLVRDAAVYQSVRRRPAAGLTC